MRNLTEHKEEENCHNTVRLGKFWGNNYVEYESKGDRHKINSVEKYLSKIRPCIKDIINKLKNTETCKIQLIIAIDFSFSKDNNEQRVVNSKSYNIEIRVNDKANKAEEPFQSLLSTHKIALELSMTGGDFSNKYYQEKI